MRAVSSAHTVVHYKDCSRYNWHDPDAQCDGARCHPAPTGDAIERGAYGLCRDGYDLEPEAAEAVSASVIRALLGGGWTLLPPARFDGPVP